MGILSKLFSKKDKPIKTYEDFWHWFQLNERAFYKAVKQGENIHLDFFNALSIKLNELKDGFFFQAGMVNDTTAELIITADGNVKHIVFVEELINVAPSIAGWQFTALKPEEDLENVNIRMGEYVFGAENIYFYENIDTYYPDEINITLVHNDYNEQDKDVIINGTFLFVDHFLGELNFVSSIDNIKVTGKENNTSQLIPIEKLKGFVSWKQKEFVEKYEGVRYNSEDDQYTLYEAECKNGIKLLAVIDADLLCWDSKASHPWILTLEINYDGKVNEGLPDEDTYTFLQIIEDELLAELKDFEGNVYLGRQTGNSIREIYFACKDFRKPTKVAYNVIQKYAATWSITYDIFKDKYWRVFERFNKY